MLQVVSKQKDSSSIASMAEGTRIHQLTENVSGLDKKCDDLAQAQAQFAAQMVASQA